MKFQRGSIFRPENEYYKQAGTVLIIGAIQFFLAITFAEALFPGYSVGKNSLSYLGGSIPLVEPSAMIFNTSVVLFGLLGVLAVYLILKSGGCRLFSLCLLISSIGAIGVGLCPEYTGSIHLFFASTTFLFGSLATIFSYRLGLNIPMVIISMVLGIISLITLIILAVFGHTPASNPLIAYLGVGGNERLITYPIILYFAALGGYLTSRGKDWVRIRFTNGYF
jgi:hypothetical membrane protein